jgi:hypothetical protein
MTRKTPELHRRLSVTIGTEDLPVYCTPKQELLRQVIRKSREPHIAQYTPQDKLRRFRDIPSLNKWARVSGRVIYAATNTAGDQLAGVINYKPQAPPASVHAHLPEGARMPTHTLGLRMYEGYRDPELALALARVTLSDYFAQPENGVDVRKFGGLWARPAGGNEPMVELCKEMRFEELGNDNDRLSMVLSPGLDLMTTIFRG